MIKEVEIRGELHNTIKKIKLKKEYELISPFAFQRTYFIGIAKALTEKVYLSKKLGIYLRNLNKEEVRKISPFYIEMISKLMETKGEWIEKLESLENYPFYIDDFLPLIKNNDDIATCMEVSHYLQVKTVYDQTYFGKLKKTKSYRVEQIPRLAKKYVQAYLKNLIVIDYDNYEELLEEIRRYYRINPDLIELIYEKGDNFIHKLVFLINRLTFTVDYDQHFKFCLEPLLTFLNEKSTSIPKLFISTYRYYYPDEMGKETKTDFDYFLQKPCYIDSFLENYTFFDLIFILDLLGEKGHDEIRNLNIAFFSIIEKLLIHEPVITSQGTDASITKQFIKNLSICHYLNTNHHDNSKEEIKKQFNILYSYRSSLSHGSDTKVMKALNAYSCSCFYKSMKEKQKQVDIHLYREPDGIIEETISIQLNEIIKMLFEIMEIYPGLLQILHDN